MAQNDQSTDADAAIDDAPVELGAGQNTEPVDDNRPERQESNASKSGSGSKGSSSNVSGQGQKQNERQSTPLAGNIKHGLATGLTSAIKATKAATQKVSQTAQHFGSRLMAPKHGAATTSGHEDENDSKTVSRPNWIPNKQIVYNEGNLFLFVLFILAQFFVFVIRFKNHAKQNEM